MPSIAEALETALKESETNTAEGAAPVIETPDTETPETEPRTRSADGKFAKKEPEQALETTPELAPRKAPSSWKPAAQEAFLKADRGEALTAEEIKLLTQEAERREADFHKGVSEFKGHSERAKAYDAAIAPYLGHLQKLNVDAPTAINALMRADVTLRTSDQVTKAQYFAQLAREYGIDLNQLHEQPQLDPQTQYLMNELNQLRQTQEMWQNQARQQEQMQAQNAIAQFADKQHFDAVRNEMATLLETGSAKDLQEAYDMAVWMRPDIRQSLLDQQRAEAQKQALEKAQAQKARTAAVSVKGSSPASSGVQPGNKGSLRDILAAQFNE